MYTLWPVLVGSQTTEMLPPKQSLWSSTDEPKKYERKGEEKKHFLITISINSLYLFSVE